MSSVKELLRGDVIDGSGTANYIPKFIDTNTIGNSAIYESSGNIGIGTASPQRVLHTVGDLVRFDNDAGGMGVLILDTLYSEGYRLMVNADGSSGAFTIEDMGTATSGAGTERMRIDASGNVLIGSTSAGFTTGSGMEIERASDSATLRLERTTTNTSVLELSADADQALINSRLSDPIVFAFGQPAVERMRITSGGNVLIGTAAANSSELLNLTNDAPVLFAEATNGVSGLRINVLGGSGSLFRLQSNGTSVFTVYNNGNYDFVGSDVSDIALKENITEITSGMPIIDALVPKTYNMIGRESIRKGGFIAQEVEQILPEAVHGEDGQKGLDYNSILAHAVKAIQELRAEVESLKSQLNV